MSYTKVLVHDVTIIRAADAVDRYGNVTKDWANATRRLVKGWVSQQGAIGRPATQENLDNREAQISAWMAYFHHDEDIHGLDRIEWEGQLFEVEGPINPAWSARTSKRHHIEVRLRVVEG